MWNIRGKVLTAALMSVLLIESPAVKANGVRDGELVCWKKGGARASCYDPRCDPCRVGPVRRFFRCLVGKCCPAPCPPAVRIVPAVPVPVPPPPPVFVPGAASPPPAVVPPRPAPAVPPAAPVPPPAEFPGTGSSLRKSGILTPPTPPPPIRADRIASRGESTVPVRLP